MSRQRYLALYGTIGPSGLTDVATTHTFTAPLTYLNGSPVPSLTGSDTMTLTLFDSTGALTEVVTLTAYNSATGAATMLRAQESTTAVAHSSGDGVTQGWYPGDIPSVSGTPAIAPSVRTQQSGFIASGTTVITVPAGVVSTDYIFVNLASPNGGWSNPVGFATIGNQVGATAGAYFGAGDAFYYRTGLQAGDTFNLVVTTNVSYEIVYMKDVVSVSSGWIGSMGNNGTNTNLSTTPKSLNCTLPDLTNSANPTSSYNAGQNGVQFQVTVSRSGGPLPAASVYVLDRVFFSTNSTWDSNDTLLWESNGSTPDFPVGVLNNSGTKTVTPTVNIPNVAAGTYYIIAFVDPFTSSFPNGFEPESNENNNIAVYPVTINTNQSPTITSSPPSGPQITTTFTTTGTHFTPNGQVQRFLTFPNQSTPQQISGITADSQGNVSFPYGTSCADTPGTYSLYLVDVATNRQSNTVTEIITASSGCNAPTISISPQSVAQGTTLSITGANFTPNGQVRRFTVFPNGVTYELPGATANNSGQISISVPTDCTTAVGSYTTYMLDVSSNKQSIRASDEITANSSCTSTASLSVAPGSGPSGTQFRFTGNGFTRCLA